MVYSSVFDMNATHNTVMTNQHFEQPRLTNDEIQMAFIPNLDDVFADMSLWRPEHRSVSANGPSQQVSINRAFDVKGFHMSLPQPSLPKQNVKDVALYKTEMCRSFEETGSCRYGEKCQFAHGASELRVVRRHPKYKTQYCRTFWEQGCCPYGKRCCFIHSQEDVPSFESHNSKVQHAPSPTPVISSVEKCSPTNLQKNLKAEWVKTSKAIGHSWEKPSATPYPAGFQLFNGFDGNRSQPVSRPAANSSFLHSEWSPFSGLEKSRKLSISSINQELPERLSAFTQFF